MDLEAEIQRLKGEIEHRDYRIKQLIEERDAERKLASDMREHIEKANELIEDKTRLIESWIECFNMTLTEKGWDWSDYIKANDEFQDKYSKLLNDWNRWCGAFNDAQAGLRQPVGRPLGASESQVAEVLKMRSQGAAYHDIADETSLSMRTVRTIITRDSRTDRTTRRHAELQKIPVDRKEQIRHRARRRTRDTIPARVNQFLKASGELVKEGKELLKR
jgi:hypothetical protein